MSEKEECALMGCKIKEGTPTLKEMAEGKECQGKFQAKLLIESGFKSNDKLCEDCFWK